jgi:thiol-disulfide isomerase/thioredoxin
MISLLIAAASLIAGGQCTLSSAQDAGAQPAATTAKPAYVKKDTWFTLNTFDGKKVDLAEYQGKPVMIIFFASYCPWCKKTAPIMENFSKVYAQAGLNVLGIDVEPSTDTAASFAQDFNITFPVLADGSVVAASYRARGIPFIFLLDKSHDIARRWAGYPPDMGEEMSEAIADTLGIKPIPAAVLKTDSQAPSDSE